MNKSILQLFRRRGMTIFFIALMSSYFWTFSIEATSLYSHFRIPSKVAEQTAMSEDITVYFSEFSYNMPSLSNNIDVTTVGKLDDPIEGYNRSMFAFNYVLIRYILQPIGEIYGFVMPEYGRKGIARMADNIEMPGRLINCLLQWRLTRAELELSRFFINTTAGGVGFYDVANSYVGIEPQTNSFGQTFAYWGIGSGFYFVIPVQGGTTFRDAVGLPLDWLADPITWIPPYDAGFNVFSTSIKGGIEINDMTLVVDDYLQTYDSSADPYKTLKFMFTALNRIKEQDQLSNGYNPEDNEL